MTSKDYLVKLAAVKKPDYMKSLKTIGMNVASMLTVMGLSAAVDKLIDVLRERRLTTKKREYFEQMMEAHPQLLKLPPETVARYWESLFRFAPNMAEDPLAAGAFITQTATRVSGEEFGGPPPDTYNTLTAIQKNIMESRLKAPKFFNTNDFITKSMADFGKQEETKKKKSNG